jgi:hypothetical protein
MATVTCTKGHDHSKEDVAIPLKRGRKYHCPSGLETSAKRRKGYWRRGTLADALEAGVPQCELCFGTRR